MKFKSPKVGPADQELNAARVEIQRIRTSIGESEQLFADNFPALDLKTPDTVEEVKLCKVGVENHIYVTDKKKAFVVEQNNKLTEVIGVTAKERDLQKSMHDKSTDVVKSFIPPAMKSVDGLHLRALTIPETELVHTRIYDDVCTLHDIGNFDIILSRTPDGNKKSSQGKSPIDYATMYSFKHAIAELIKKGATSSDAFIYSLRLDLTESAKLLVQITGELVGYKEIFTNLKSDSFISDLDLSNTSLSREGLSCLSKPLITNKSLSVLNISNNNIDSLGVVFLGDMLSVNHNIVNLDISNNNLGYKGILILVEALEKNMGIKLLNISSNNIGIEGGAIVSRLIDSNNQILNLNVASNNLEDMGAAHILAKISKHSRIQEINLAKNNITDSLAEDIEEVLNQIHSLIILDLTGNNLSSTKTFSIEQIMFTTIEHKVQTLLTSDIQNSYDYNLELLAEVLHTNDFE